MLDVTNIKNVSSTHIFFKDDTNKKMTVDIATELYEVTTHLIYAIPILEKMSDDTHNIPFKGYIETDGGNWIDKINIEIANKYARLDNEKLAGRREEIRNTIDAFRKFRRINKICREYLNSHK